MKRINLIGLFASMAAFLLLASCGTSSMTPLQKKAQEQKVANSVWEQLDAKSFTIDVDYMNPLRGGGKALNTPYSITVDGNTIDSHLPYVGEAQNIPYGGGKGLTFKDEILEYKDGGLQKDRRIITLTTNNGEDKLTYTITVFDNGKADIHVNSRTRDDIGYIGSLVLDEKE